MHSPNFIATYRTLLITAMSLLSCMSCKKAQTEQEALLSNIVAEYGAYNPELKKLSRYLKRNPNDDIGFLIENMLNKFYVHVGDNSQIAKNWKSNIVPDLVMLNTDSLIWAAQRSRQVWEASSWKNLYNEEVFREYVLPYRFGHEPMEYYWKEHARNTHPVELADSFSVIDYAKAINSNSGFKIDLNITDNFYSYSALSTAKTGKCIDWTLYSVYLMRAAGLPATEDFIVNWGNLNDSHSIPVLILPDGGFLHFEAPGGGINLMNNAIPKVYRQTYSINRQTPLYKYRETESIPPSFALHTFKDVTGEYDHMLKRDLTVEIPNDRIDESKLVYLGVFNRGELVPVAYAENIEGIAEFKNLGTYHFADGEYVRNGENPGKGILYFPCFYVDNDVRHFGHPLILGKDSVRELIPNKEASHTMILKRKYPRKAAIIRHADRTRGGVFEVANREDFSDARQIYKIYDTPMSRAQTVRVNPYGSYKYVRYLIPKGLLSLGLLKFYDHKGDEVKGKPVADPLLALHGDIGVIFDDDPLTYITTSPSFDLWVGMEFPQPVRLSSIEYCPRTDDNDIAPGDEYELFFWNNGWQSLGRKTAEDYQITYEDTPSNALFWLRNLTRGQEERPFTYENGTQVWW